MGDFSGQTEQVPFVAANLSQHHDSREELVSGRDREMLRQCLANAAGSWDGFVERYGGLIAFVVDRTTGQRGADAAGADRDDLVAEVFVEIMRNDAAVLRSFAGRASFPSYLTVIARRVAVRSLVRRARQRPPQQSTDTAAAAADRCDHAAATADRDQIETLLGRLEPAAAQLVRLHHLEGRSYGEISRLTGMPLNSIGPALSQARQLMRDAGHEG